MMKPEIRDQRSEVRIRPPSSGACQGVALGRSLVRRPSSVVCRPSSLLRQGFAGQAVVWRRASSSGRRPSSLFSGLASGVRRLSSAGFSLVEVTLALMVMAIGILSIMSLFPAGLDQNARSIADTHAAFFAEEVFGGLQAKAETNWVNLAEAQLPVAASDMWSPGTNVFVTGPNVATNIYKFGPYEDHALRYRLVLTTNGLLKKATLFVWPGEFGTTNNPSIFYAEFFRFRP